MSELTQKIFHWPKQANLEAQGAKSHHKTPRKLEIAFSKA